MIWKNAAFSESCVTGGFVVVAPRVLWAASLHLPDLATPVGSNGSQQLFHGVSMVFTTDLVSEGSADCQGCYFASLALWVCQHKRSVHPATAVEHLDMIDRTR